MTTRTLVGQPEVSKRLGIGRGAVYELVSRNEIPHIRLGRSIRFDMERIEQWIGEQMRVGA